MTELTEEGLLRRVRAGDPEGFGILVERLMRRAYVHALGIVGSRGDARDLSQEAFARAFGARHTLDPERPFYAWLYQILRRLCFNFPARPEHADASAGGRGARLARRDR